MHPPAALERLLAASHAILGDDDEASDADQTAAVIAEHPTGSRGGS